MVPPSTPIRSADPGLQALVHAIGDQFAVEGEFVLGEEIDSGHINSTYRATYRRRNGKESRYIFQSINRNVFKDPYAVMNNVEAVTRHINERVLRLKKNLGGQTLSLFPARAGGSWIEDEHGAVWRCYNFIEGCVTYDIVENTARPIRRPAPSVPSRISFRTSIPPRSWKPFRISIIRENASTASSNPPTPM